MATSNMIPAHFDIMARAQAAASLAIAAVLDGQGSTEAVVEVSPGKRIVIQVQREILLETFDNDKEWRTDY